MKVKVSKDFMADVWSDINNSIESIFDYDVIEINVLEDIFNRFFQEVE